MPRELAALSVDVQRMANGASGRPVLCRDLKEMRERGWGWGGMPGTVSHLETALRSLWWSEPTVFEKPPG